MLKEYRHQRLLAMALTALAGYVDSIGYLQLGGFYVSFMSGNSTRVAIGLSGHLHAAGVAFGIIGAFVAGAMLGTLTGHRVRADDRSFTVLALVAGLLAIAAIVGTADGGVFAVVSAALAMGAENTVFEHDSAVGVGVTYMTWTLVTLGKRLAGVAMGEERWAWLPHLLLWASLVAGAALGAEAYGLARLQALWLAVLAALVLAAVTAVGRPLHKTDFTA